jgi:hypothetical protein
MRIATVAREAEHRGWPVGRQLPCPTIPIPISLRSSAVTFGRTIFVDLVVAESRLIPLKAKAPQPTPISMVVTLTVSLQSSSGPNGARALSFQCGYGYCPELPGHVRSMRC